MGALDHDVGIPFWEAEPFIGFIVLFLLAVGVYPSRTRLLHPEQRTKANIYAGFQRLVGRLSCITLAGTILLEVITGKVSHLSLWSKDNRGAGHFAGHCVVIRRQVTCISCKECME